MKQISLVYIPCKNLREAKKLGRLLLEARLCACTNILGSMVSQYRWPPKENKIGEAKEVVLIGKTLEDNLPDIELLVVKHHSYAIPCILGIPAVYVSDAYYNWLLGEVR